VIFSQGTTFGAYRILAPLGRGGMGEVYRARDTRLGRDVALKVIREDSAGYPHRVMRFEQEARAASSLNHPNIVVIYEAGDAMLPGRTEPLRYLAMELLDGKPLASLLTGEPLPLRRVLDWASQLADGLARAHESGILHRDLKPSNVLVTSEGRVKILDFGLAKLREPLEEDTEFPTAAGETLTEPGIAVGTVGYMSPEQTRGEPATAASDQFSFGCILYEMLTGRPAFGRKSKAETLSAILRDEPPSIEESNPNVPAPIRWIVERCLAKSPADRYVSTRDLAREIQAFREHSSEGILRALPAASRIYRRRRLLKIVGAAALLILGAAGTLLLTQKLKLPPEPDFRRLTFRQGVVWRALFVPNSDTILYTASWDGMPAKSYLTIRESAGNERSLESEDQLPMAYSADGSQVLVLLGRSRAAINARGTLAWWPALGGKTRPIVQNAGWADWSEASRLLAVVRDTGAERVLDVRTANGALERSVFRTSGGVSYVRFSPDGKTIAFIHHASRYDDAGEVRIAEIGRPISRALTPRFERCAGLDWNEHSGEIWFTASRANVSTSTLWKVGLSGKIRPLQSLPDFFVLQDVSPSGTRCLLISSASGTGMFLRLSGGVTRDLTWLGSSAITDISPDGKSLLFGDGGAGERSLGTWTRPIDGGDAVRLGAATPGKFSPDGRSIVALTPQLSGPQQILLVPVGPGATRQLTFSQASHSMPSFAGPDTILFVRSHAGQSEVWRMATDGTDARSLGADGCDMPSASPSGRAFLCRGGETKNALYLFPMDRGEGRKLVEIPDGRTISYARWSGSGAEIFAVTSDLRFLTIDGSTGGVLAQEALALGKDVGSDSLLSAAFNPDATIQAYSFERSSSGLYLADGL
jgi:serine/threonine protein kinase/Tol biopolymer transport system component